MRLFILVLLANMLCPSIHAQNGYDSLQNFLGANPNLYIGEDLYLTPKPDYQRAEGYEGFVLDPKKDKYDKSNVYRCCAGYSSQYDAMAGKQYKVLQVIKHPKAAGTRFADIHYLQLQAEDGSKFYYEYNARLEHKFPFILQSYWAKARSLHTGAQYVIKNSVLKNKVDIANSRLLNGKAGDIWTCQDVTVDEADGKLSLVLQNDKGQKFLTPLATVQVDSGIANFYTPDAVSANKLKYGNYWMSILLSEVKMGMTGEMCRLSWGAPARINNTVVQGVQQEQWVYEDGHYLYFKNGKLSTVQ